MSGSQIPEQSQNRTDDLLNQTRPKQQNKEYETVGTQSVVEPRDWRRRESRQDPTAVERRDRDQVEHHEDDVQCNAGAEKERQGIQDRVARVQLVRKENQQGLQADEKTDGEDKVACRACRCNQDVIALGMTQEPGIDRHRLGPSKKRKTRQKAKRREKQRPDRVDMRDWVQGDPAHKPSRRVAKTLGHPGMRRLVKTEREEQHDQVDQNPREVNIGQGIHRVIIPWRVNAIIRLR